MKFFFIIANWKSNKTIDETEKWLHEFHEKLISQNLDLSNKEIIICPSYILFEHAHYCSKNLNLPVKFGAQNISPFEEGAYTGEVNGRQVKEFAEYVIIGHSERRNNFSENEERIFKKMEMVQNYNLNPILCISKLNQIQNSKFKIQNYNSKIKSLVIAYEPLFAIGSGKPDTPQNAEEMAQNIKKELGSSSVLYGGSVTSGNVNGFTKMPNIDGVLVGGASLDPLEFLEIIKNA